MTLPVRTPSLADADKSACDPVSAVRWLRTLGRIYTVSASYIVTTLLFLVLLNIAVYYLILPRLNFFITRLPLAEETNISMLGLNSLRKVYPSMSDTEIELLIGETWGRGQVYEPWAEFKEMPFNGTYYNQSPNGYRSNGKEFLPWPPNKNLINIFIYGGSTLYGYSVPDSDTIPAYLSRLLNDRYESSRIAVYNFGNGFYYSVQERIRFENLLLNGVKPDIAIFVDGLNDFLQITDQGEELPGFKHLVEAALRGEYHVPVSEFERLPMLQLIKQLKTYRNRSSGVAIRKNKRVTGADKIQILRSSWSKEPESLLRMVVSRYHHNQKLIEHISKAYGVRPIFVWQPVPSYNYDLRNHLFLFKSNPLSAHTRGQEGYKIVKGAYEDGKFGPHSLWLGDMQQDLNRPLYADPVHYTSEMNMLIAREIEKFTTLMYPEVFK